MPKKKARKSSKKTGKKQQKKDDKRLVKFFSALFDIIIFLITLPFKTIGLIIKIINSINQKTKEKRQIKIQKLQKEKRDAIEAKYEEFLVVEQHTGDIIKWEKNLANSTIGIILGARGKGKSALGIKLLENIKTKSSKKLYALGFNQDDLPGWINVVDEVSKIASDSFVLIDEGGILFSSRRSMTDANQILSDLILISRHKNLSILFISQNSANLDINILRQADYLLLKPSSLLQKDFERKKIKELYDEVKEKFEIFKEYKGLTYIYSEDFRGFVNNPLPSFWSMNISKSFK